MALVSAIASSLLLLAQEAEVTSHRSSAVSAGQENDPAAQDTVESTLPAFHFPLEGAGAGPGDHLLPAVVFGAARGWEVSGSPILGGTVMSPTPLASSELPTDPAWPVPGLGEGGRSRNFPEEADGART